MTSNHKIDLMIVGAQKAGTTSLKNYLGQHPAIITHLQTEFTFFIEEKEYSEGIESTFNKYFSDVVSDSLRTIVAKSAAMYFNEKSLQRLRASNPNCQVVMLLRNPVERAYSSYLMEVNSGWFDQPWSDIKNSLQKFKHGEKDQMFRLFIELGLYAEHLEKIYRCFPKEQVLILSFEDLKINPVEICKTIFRRMGIDDSFIPETSKRFNPSKRPHAKHLSKLVTWLRFNNNPLKRVFKFILPPATFTQLGHWITDSISKSHQPESMDRGLQLLLSDFFKPYNVELEKMTGMNFRHWDLQEEGISSNLFQQ